MAGEDIDARDFGENYAAISGTLRDSSGNPVAGATITITDSAGNTFTTVTAADGTYFVSGSADEPMALGPATVVVTVGDQRVTTTVSVDGASTIALADLDLPAVVPTPLPQTGGEAFAVVRLALLLFAVGALFVLVSRGRRRRQDVLTA